MTAITRAGQAPATDPGAARGTTTAVPESGPPLLAGVVVLLAAFAVLGVAFALRVPALHNPDEVSHLRYATGLADHLALPGSADVAEKQQPPLYYLLAAALLKLGGGITALRLLGVCFGAAAVGATVAVTRRLAPARPLVALGAGALVAGLPAVAAVSGAVSNDSLAWAAGGLLLWCTVTVLLEPAPRPLLLVACGLAAAVGLLAKETDWPLVAVLAGAVAWSWGRDLRAGGVLVVAGIPAAACGWWFARNIALFHSLTPPLRPITAREQQLRTAGQLRGLASEAVRSLFGPEAPTGGPLPRSGWVIAAMWALSALGGLLLAAAALAVRRSWATIAPRRRAAVCAALAAGVLVVCAWLANSVLIDLQPQARYLLVAAPVAAAAIAWGAAEAGARRRGLRLAAVCGVAVLLLALDIDALRVAVERTA